MSYPSQGGGAPAAVPNNNMTIAVISLVLGVLCGSCLGAIPGIIAVVNAGKVGGLAASGNYGGAQEAAANARRWAIIGFVITAIVFVLIVIIQIAAANSDTSTTY